MNDDPAALRSGELVELYYQILYLDDDPYGYSLKSKYKTRNEQVLGVLREHLAGGALLDIGSGVGQLMSLVGREFATLSITCVEPSSSAIGRLRAAGFQAIHSGLPHLAGVDGLYDCVTCFDAFNYMTDREQKNEAAATIHGLLVPGGHFIVDDRNASDLTAGGFRLASQYRFDGETVTVSLFNLIERPHRMLGHVLKDDRRDLFERYDALKNRTTTQNILRYRFAFSLLHKLAWPLVWLNRLVVGSVTVRRLLAAIQRCSYQIYVYKRL